MKKLLFFAVIFLLVISCRPLKRPVNVNFAHLYNPELHTLSPEFVLIHQANDSTLLQLYIDGSQLLYVRDGREDFFLSHFKLSWYLFESFQSRNLIDSAQIRYTDTLHIDGPGMLTRETKIPAMAGNRYVLFLELEDLNRRTRFHDVVFLDKSHPFTSQFFVFHDNENNEFASPFFLPLNETFQIRYGKEINFDMTVNLYPPLPQIPPPPYVLIENQLINPEELEPDTIFMAGFSQGRSSLTTSKPGFYHFHEVNNPSHGFSAFAFFQGYPQMEDAAEMIKALRYITSRDEYEQLFAHDDARYALERFWNRTAGNPDRAQELIIRYFNRVENANILFTSFVPGWQTDRGMIYIIFGPPHKVHKSDDRETWEYTEGMNLPSARFVFHYSENNFSNNHFLLERSPGFRSIWNHAVSVWRR